MKIRLLALFWLVLLGTGAPAQESEVTWLIRGKGGRVDWGPQSKLAYDAPGKDGYTDVWVMDVDGSNRRCLTDGPAKVPQLHCGNPAWHPNGELLVFQALDPEVEGPLVGTPVYRMLTGPGAGLHNDIWMVDRDGQRAWRLTALGRDKGVLHPHFSPDGKWLVWAEMVISKPAGFGTWEIVLAPFKFENGVAAIGKSKRLRPGGLQFYETHGFSPDGSKLIFTGVPSGGAEDAMDIYVCDLDGQSLERLTGEEGRNWDEHAHFTPDGRHIIWMSSAGNGLETKELNNFKVKTDFWIMAADGSHKRRLTFFNRKGSAHFLPGKNIASDLSISPDGDRFVFYVQDKGKKLFTWGSIGIGSLED